MRKMRCGKEGSFVAWFYSLLLSLMLSILFIFVDFASSLPALPFVSPSVDLGQGVQSSNALNVYILLGLFE